MYTLFIYFKRFPIEEHHICFIWRIQMLISWYQCLKIYCLHDNGQYRVIAAIQWRFLITPIVGNSLISPLFVSHVYAWLRPALGLKPLETRFTPPIKWRLRRLLTFGKILGSITVYFIVGYLNHHHKFSVSRNLKKLFLFNFDFFFFFEGILIDEKYLLHSCSRGSKHK